MTVLVQTMPMWLCVDWGGGVQRLTGTCWLMRARLQCRDSKLTRILEDSIGGNCKTTMMAMISPALEAYAGKAPYQQSYTCKCRTLHVL